MGWGDASIRQQDFGVNLSIGNAIKTQKHEEIKLHFRNYAEKALRCHQILWP